MEKDSFYLTTQGSAVIQRHIIHQHGVVVAGPSPQTLPDPVAADELRRALHYSLEQWWRPLLDDPAWLQQRQQQPFAILTLGRTFYTLEHGVVASKPVTARWGQQTMDQPWLALFEWALAWPHDMESDQLAATLRLIQYTLDCYQYHYERV